jgi:hypothetical protein
MRQNDRGWLVLKPACEALGIDAVRQRNESVLVKAPWATASVIEAVGADGKQREMFCLRSDRVAMWLATIDTTRITDPAARQRLEVWQCEAAEALDKWWRGKQAPVGEPAQSGHTIRGRCSANRTQDLEARGPAPGHRAAANGTDGNERAERGRVAKPCRRCQALECRRQARLSVAQGQQPRALSLRPSRGPDQLRSASSLCRRSASRHSALSPTPPCPLDPDRSSLLAASGGVLARGQSLPRALHQQPLRLPAP